MPGQVFERLQVIRVVPEKHRIVGHACRNEHVVLRTLAVAVVAVDEQPLDPRVPHAAGVARIVRARREVAPHRAVAGQEELHLRLGKVRRLLESDHVVLLPLILKHVRLAVAVSELDAAAVRKQECALRRLIRHRAGKLPLQRKNVVLVQFRQRAAQQQEVEPRVTKGKEHELSSHCPRLAASARAAVRHVPRFGKKEPLLLRIRRSR